jgi:uncharacterized membrane protein YfcA
MTLPFAIGTSLVSVTAFGTATASSYAKAGLIDWRIALIFVAGGIRGGCAGMAGGRRLAGQKGALGVVPAAVIVTVGVHILVRTLVPGALALAT